VATDTAINRESRGVKANPAFSPFEIVNRLRAPGGVSIRSRSDHHLMNLQGQGESKEEDQISFLCGALPQNGPCILGNTEDPMIFMLRGHVNSIFQPPSLPGKAMSHPWNKSEYFRTDPDILSSQ
jgi:hypothetical protein